MFSPHFKQILQTSHYHYYSLSIRMEQAVCPPKWMYVQAYMGHIRRSRCTPYLPIYMHILLQACTHAVHVYLPTYLHAHTTCMHTYLPIYMHILHAVHVYIPTYLHAHTTCMHTYLPIYMHILHACTHAVRVYIHVTILKSDITDSNFKNGFQKYNESQVCDKAMNWHHLVAKLSTQ